MVERRIIVGWSAEAEGRDRAIRINGPDPTFTIATDRLAKRLVAPIPGRLLDLVEIAAAVFAADSMIPRGGATRSRFGAGWRREFAFEIAVREPDFWRQSRVQSALRQVIDVLSEDEARFSFSKACEAADLQDYFPFDPDADEAFQCDDVVLFSGGLDSLVGTIERLEAGRGRIALVTHLSARKRMPHQTHLALELQRRYPGRVLWLPIHAHLSQTKSRDRTQRSRSLLFTALAFTAARMLGGSRVTFFENGIVSQNLPISDQVIGTMATRTTHPLGLRRLAELMSMVAGDEVVIENPFEWLTKTEVVSKLRDFGAEDLVARSVSCSRVWQRTVEQPHCGACSQCLNRRFAVLAAGMAEHDPPNGYATDVLTGERERDESRTMAVEWARHAIELSQMDPTAYLERFGSEMTRIREGFPSLAPVVTMRQITELHRRHGKAVREVLDAAVFEHSRSVVDGQLLGSSLLAMFLHAQTGERGAVSAGSREPPALEGGDAEAADLFPLQVVLGGDLSDASVEVRGLGGLTSAPSRVVAALSPLHLEDQGAGRAPEDHRFMKGKEAADALGETEIFVRQNVKRCRRELAEYYAVVAGVPPSHDLLVETRRQAGYRLDPECRLIRQDRPSAGKGAR